MDSPQRDDNSRQDRIIFSESYFSPGFDTSLQYEDVAFNINIPPILEKQNIHYRCPKCFNFPVIDFIENNEEFVYYTCNCYDKKPIRMEELFKNEKKETTYMTFSDNNNILSNVLDNIKKDLFLGFKCNKHKTQDSFNNFEYYCFNDKKNICKDCVQEHLSKDHHLLPFDYQNYETNEKMNEILKYIEEKEIEKLKEENESQINLDKFEELNKDYKEDEKSGNINILNNISDNFLKLESKKDPETIHKRFTKLINIIIYDYLNYPNYSHFFTIENIYRVLIKSAKKEEENEAKKDPYIKLIFHFNNNDIKSITCKASAKVKDIKRTFLDKSFSLYPGTKLIYKGFELEEESKIEEIISEKDKRNNKMEITLSNKHELDRIKLEEIKCPKCKESISLNFIDYKINLHSCNNNHKKEDISINDFMKTQDLSYLKGVKCDNCYKSLIFQDSFYKCFTCKKNLCPSCKEKHVESHKIFDFNEFNNICKEHNGNYLKYCKDCKKNICVICEKSHLNHNIIEFNHIIPKKENILKEEENLKQNIEKIKKDVKLLTYKLNSIINNMELYQKIYHELINSFFKNKTQKSSNNK